MNYPVRYIPVAVIADASFVELPSVKLFKKIYSIVIPPYVKFFLLNSL